MDITSRDLIFLSAIHLSGGAIAGTTRLQKLLLIISKEISKQDSSVQAFNDWKPDKFGGVSSQVYQTVPPLTAKGLLEEKAAKLGQYDGKLYLLTESGRLLAQRFLDSNRGPEKVIRHIAEQYLHSSTKDLIADAYSLYPELTILSKIKPEINRALLKRSKLSPEYEEDIGGMTSLKGRHNDSAKEYANDERFLKKREFEMQKLPDLEARKKLASLIGLAAPPKLDAYAIYRMDGLIKHDIPKDKKFDSVELVRSVRGD